MTTNANIRVYLFGTFDRKFTTISCLLSVISISITVILWGYPDSLPVFIIIRDVFVVSTLSVMFGVISCKYIRRDISLVETTNKLSLSNQLLNKQFSIFHTTPHNIRNMLYGSHIDYLHDDYDVFSDYQLIESTCKQAANQAIKSMINYIHSKGFEIHDLSSSVKIAIPNKQLSEVLPDKTPGDQANKDKTWLITIARDTETCESSSKQRETGTKFFDTAKNTAFANIFNCHNQSFACDNLAKLGTRYNNENKNWKDQYNATLVVPIRYHDNRTGNCYNFGVLTINSMNEKGYNLFDHDGIAVEVLGHIADILAIMFLVIQIKSHYKRLQP